MPLVLWDIDGTLLGSAGFADTLLRTALAQTYGATESLATMVFAGKTDSQIIAQLYGLSPHAQDQLSLNAFVQCYTDLLANQRRELRAQLHVLPGVAALVVLFAQHGVIQSVATGNVRPAAHLKLDLFGLSPYLDLTIGAYGDETTERAALVQLAITRAQTTHPAHLLRTVVVIGDTPADIAAGRAAGAATIGVATGSSDRASLRAAGADWVFDNLRDTEAVLAAIHTLDTPSASPQAS